MDTRKSVIIEFAEPNYPAIPVETDSNLSYSLNAKNSPVLFGCRSGICGTCLVEVLHPETDKLNAPENIEIESLSLYSPENPRARLACQLLATTSMQLKRVRPD